MNSSRSRVKTFITNNPKTVFWSTAGTLFITIISVGGNIWLYKRMKKCDTESHVAESINDGAIAIKKMQVGTDSDLVKVIQEGEIAIRKKRNDTECDILTTAAQTAFKMMEQATAVAPELNVLKAEVLATKEELTGMKEALIELNNLTSADSDEESDMTLNGRSSFELFNRPRTENATWIVCGYMKVNQVNLIVAGSGVGKTTIMVQIALAVAKGIRPEFLPEECSVSVRQSVKYYRLEDFDDELQGKYGNGKVFHGSDITWYLSRDIPDFSLDGFLTHLKSLANTLTEDTLVCIDPATKLPGYTHEKFIQGVEKAMAIAKARNITLTIIGTVHLDEIKDWSVLTNCDIKGGDKAIQQAGSVTAIRRERTDVENYRFLQCLKEPKGSPKPFNGDALVCKIKDEAPDGNKYLHYQYDCLKSITDALPDRPKQTHKHAKSPDRHALKAPHQKVTPEMEQKIMDMAAKGVKQTEIAQELKISAKTVSRHMKQ